MKPQPEDLERKERYVCADRIVGAILNDLHDRSGIGNELDSIDKDVYKEMREDLIKAVLVWL